MANPEHLKILKKGSVAWNVWRMENLEITPDLSNAHLEEKNFSEFNFQGAYLQNVNFRNANLSFTNFRNANLKGAILDNTYFDGANLSGANLSKANLTEANLSYSILDKANLSDATIFATNFTGSYLGRANLQNAILNSTILANCDLRGIQNLDTCKHTGASVLDHSTLAKSGALPLIFLRGCGLPDFIIENIQVLQNSALIFYSCFISHSTKNDDFASRLYADLQSSGIRCWFAPEDMEGGRKLHDQINEAIRIHDKLLLILSQESMNSNWVADEIKRARKRETREGKQMLFPISITPFDNIVKWELFDSDEGRDLAQEIRSYYIPDFSNWKDHDSYQRAFEKLIEALKGRGAKSGI